MEENTFENYAILRISVKFVFHFDHDVLQKLMHHIHSLFYLTPKVWQNLKN